MKTKNKLQLISLVLFILISSLTLPSCAVFSSKKVNTQKRGLMLQDKSEYSTNKGKMKKSKGKKTHKKSAKKIKRYKHR